MKTKYLLFLFIAVVAFCCAGQSGKASADAGADAYDSTMQANGYDELKLFKTPTGHITVTLQVNGKPCVLLVDTGGGATLIDISKREKYRLEAIAMREYAAGIGSVSPLVRTSALVRVGEHEFRDDSLFLMDIGYLNAEFKKVRSRQVDGVLGTDFLERHRAIIDYSRSKIYLK